VEKVRDFPLFTLGMVALPSELVPLHVFEDRYKAMIEHCLETGSEFGIVWLADDGLRRVGCACEIAEVSERLPDGRLNIVARGTRPFRIESREDRHPYPAATVVFLEDGDRVLDDEALDDARAAFAALVQEATDAEPEPAELAGMSAYEMASAVDFGPDAKQGLLDLRSETARLRLLARLLRAALRRMDFIDSTQERARTNGRIHFLP
jgi:Lon protease-like protein